jgi:hypothetical protein
VTKKERWDVAIAIAATTAYVVYLFASLYSQREGMGDGAIYRLRWHSEQARRAREREQEFQRLRNEVLFDAWLTVNSARPQ